MSVIAAFSYRDGMRQGAVDFAAPVSERDNEFEWVGLFEPTAEELHAVAQRYHLHPLPVEDAQSLAGLPKLEVYGRHLFVKARTVSLIDTRMQFGLTSFFVSENFIVTVRLGSSEGHSLLRERIEDDAALLVQGPDFVLHAVLDLIIDGYFPPLDRIGEKLDHFEEEAVDGGLDRSHTKEVFSLRRQLLRLQRQLVPMEEVCAKLAHLDLPAVDPEMRPYFRDVNDHVHRAETLTRLQREVLASVMETSALIEQQNQNAITRQLAAWAAILAVPTAIAGIYGMNFEVMPELQSRWGYPLILLVIVSVSIGLWFRFRRLGWL
ncbi:magnesium and cobalt transport protein CorA [Croceicoccus ponticola]|uniref:Magnesium and cobalt transport protein CorA n=1 Tax=Croceicoccus ponticola TaxID=2217664 RepID=A0A437GZ85_9SPHN|nr:magnesium and cobalt transport protein CorA [Croceicoccus ponticola]RVQ68664.1 magnesium and cobalt transport protein CorA [Croceicoccus ponticola]